MTRKGLKEKMIKLVETASSDDLRQSSLKNDFAPQKDHGCLIERFFGCQKGEYSDFKKFWGVDAQQIYLPNDAFAANDSKENREALLDAIRRLPE